MATTEFGNKLLSTEEAAKALGLSTRTLEGWRVTGGGPRFVRLSRRAVRYRPSELARFVETRELASTTDPGSR